MNEVDNLLEVEILLEATSKTSSHKLYKEMTLNTLKEVIPEIYFDQKWQSERTVDTFKKKVTSLLPLVKHSPLHNDCQTISFYAFFAYRVNAFKFFFSLISQWVIPGKRLNVVLVHAIDFCFPRLGEELFTLCEVIIKVENSEVVDEIAANFTLIETEAKLGLHSEYYATKILEIKGISPNQKTASIQQHIAALIRRMPNTFSQDIFTEMQHILVLCHDDFKQQRTISHLSRLINSHYLFRKLLLESIKESPDKRHVYVKLFKTLVNYPQKKKWVLAITIGLNFLRDKEIFDERLLLKAIQHLIPLSEAIAQTFFNNRKGTENFSTLYIEIEKSDGKPFTADNIKLLKENLPLTLQNHITSLLLPVFMPRNEEEIMRNMLSLSHQLRFLRDIPQVFITFDEQTDRNLFFTVVFVRILQGNEKSIQDSVRLSNTFLRYIHDRSRIVGSIRRKYPKEATVFRVKFPKENFLRGDHSIDLYKARQTVVNELSRILGEFRDYNGGMISKQNELLNQVKDELTAEGIIYNDLLLENFFYSLTPVIMRTVIEPGAFKIFFLMLLEKYEKGLPKTDKWQVDKKYEPDFTFVLMIAHHRSVLDEAARYLHKFHLHGSELIQGYVKSTGNIFMGYIFRSMDPHKQTVFREAIDHLVYSQIETTNPNKEAANKAKTGSLTLSTL